MQIKIQQKREKKKGRLFQSFGPTTEKARSPLVFSLVLGTRSRSELVDLSDLEYDAVTTRLSTVGPDCEEI